MSQDLPARTRLTLAAQNKSFISVEITSSGDEEKFAFEREDYKPETMAIANAQAVGVTEEGDKNKYTLSIGSTIKSLQVNGYPASIENGGPGGRHVYSDEFSEPAVAPAISIFEGTSRTTSNFDFEVIKGRAQATSENQIAYPELLRELSTNPDNNRIVENTSRIAENQNGGNSAKKPYLKIGQRERDTTVGDIILQNTKGVHVPKSNALESQAQIKLSMQNLKNLGLQLMLKASGEYVSLMDKDNPEQFLASKASSLAPGLARLGTKIPVSTISVESLAREANPDFVKSDSSLMRQDDTLTYGSYNNPLVPFDSIDSRSSVAASAILIATLAGLFEALSRVFSPRDGLQSQLFQSIAGQINNIAIPTSRDYSECVRVGMQVFFSGQSGNFEQTIGGTFQNLNEAPGYYNTVLRNLVRSLTYEIGQQMFTAVVPPGMLDGVAGPYDSNTATNIKPAGVSTDVGSNIINAVRRISESRVVGFMNVLANIGDLALSAAGKNLSYEPRNNNEFAYVDTVEIQAEDVVNPAAIAYNHRASIYAQQLMGMAGNSLAWASSTTPSRYILPRSILVAADDLGGAGAAERMQAGINKGGEYEILGAGEQLSSAQVEDFENLLDASYVPFYFHDLRTNEIVSFHAFLTDMQDGFTAEYAETTGYGRVGKIYTYKNTDRSISMTFIVAATSPEDFDRMWWKINKLVTTVYPQYTAGRVIEHEGRRFVQPFSQLPAASPLMRIRLGDVWKSNYSKFALARLFGLGQGGDKFSMNQQAITEQNRQDSRFPERLAAARTDMVRDGFNQNERFYFMYTAPAGATRSVGRRTPRVPSGEPTESYQLRLVQEPNATPRQTPAGSSTTTAPTPGELVTGRYLLRVVEQPTPSADGRTKLYKVRIDDMPAAVRSTQYYIRLPAGQVEGQTPGSTAISLYDPDVETRARSAQQSQESTTDSQAQEQGNTAELVSSFFNDEANPIFKAFNTTKGKGLAGFIKSLKFDWNESTWSTGDLGNRAPMMVKVSLDFAPIHDIAPGLDVNGFNTAPVYGVGSIAGAPGTSVEKDYDSQQTARTFNAMLARPARQSETDK